MKRFIFLITLISLFLACVKREPVTVIRNTDEHSLTLTLSNDNISPSEEVRQSMPKDKKSLQEIIIENYSYAVPGTQYQPRIISFQIEGNFTGSGNSEVIAFYENISSGYSALNSAFCYVSDYTGEKVESIYYIPYGTIEFSEEDEKETGLDETLGRKIVWKDKIIGCISDFNENGLEELYLFYLSGMNRSPSIFEFNGIEFVQILDLGTVNAYITGVDPNEKVIDIRIEHPSGDTPYLTIDNNSYKWDASTQRYTILVTESKRYRWNWDIEEYEEVE